MTDLQNRSSFLSAEVVPLRERVVSDRGEKVSHRVVGRSGLPHLGRSSEKPRNCVRICAQIVSITPLSFSDCGVRAIGNAVEIERWRSTHGERESHDTLQLVCLAI
ncbi:hypothetical protein AVEN_5207-1 [Araneus ventricosus]|uniref:Uncharacterized protein n=1 Tax=Araneus ventricosus TaxID=182803 RepID=A0A4Y2G5F7_ARAVE|nr:hypothetical protein AVEN_5207-1 [Araneus ventricosus]